MGNYATAFLNNGNITIQSDANISITDMGLFSTMHDNFAGVSPSVNTGYVFQQYFDLAGNLTTDFVEGNTFVIENSTQLNGTYTIKSIYYDIANSVTKLFVNETVALTSNIVDGQVYPTNRRTLPDEWTTGTELYLTTDTALPTPFNEFIPYILNKIDRLYILIVRKP